MCMTGAAVCLRCILTCKSCSNCLGCALDRTVAAHKAEPFIIVEATCRCNLGGTHVISLKAGMNVMQAPRTTADAFGSAPCCWQKLSRKLDFGTLSAGLDVPGHVAAKQSGCLRPLEQCVSRLGHYDMFQAVQSKLDTVQSTVHT